MFDVIEHLHNPFGDVQKMYDRLNPGGGIAIATMDSESLMSRLLGTRLEDFRRIREHLYFFSRESLTKVLERAGFQVYAIKSHGHTFESWRFCLSECRSSTVRFLARPAGWWTASALAGSVFRLTRTPK